MEDFKTGFFWGAAFAFSVGVWSIYIWSYYTSKDCDCEECNPDNDNKHD